MQLRGSDILSHWRERARKGRRLKLKKIVILNGPSIESVDEYVLRECLRIMFPECDIEIRSNSPVNSPDEQIHIKPDQNQPAL